MLNLTTLHMCHGGQLCSSCSGVELGEVCQHTINCDKDEKCYMHEYKTESGEKLFDLGCTAPQECHYSSEIILGKRTAGHHLKCSACCNETALCNQNLTCDGNSNAGTSLPRDCAELIVQSQHNGSHTIYPYGVLQLPVSVYCIFDTSGAWTVIQRRFDGSVNFYRNWDAYKKGFGMSNGEYWIGNDVIHALTDRGSHRLKIILKDFANATRYATYSHFHIAEEAHLYRLFVMGYSGTAGDGMHRQDGMAFTTFDKDNDIDGSHNCAVLYLGAWWYETCHDSNLNGKYLSGAHTSYADGIEWYPWHGYHYSLKETIIMIQKY